MQAMGDFVRQLPCWIRSAPITKRRCCHWCFVFCLQQQEQQRVAATEGFVLLPLLLFLCFVLLYPGGPLITTLFVVPLHSFHCTVLRSACGEVSLGAGWYASPPEAAAKRAEIGALFGPSQQKISPKPIAVSRSHLGEATCTSV